MRAIKQADTLSAVLPVPTTHHDIHHSRHLASKQAPLTWRPQVARTPGLTRPGPLAIHWPRHALPVTALHSERQACFHHHHLVTSHPATSQSKLSKAAVLAYEVGLLRVWCKVWRQAEQHCKHSAAASLVTDSVTRPAIGRNHLGAAGATTRTKNTMSVSSNTTALSQLRARTATRTCNRSRPWPGHMHHAAYELHSPRHSVS